MSQTKLMTVSLRIFACAIAGKVLFEGAVACRATLGAAGLPRPLQRASLPEDKAKTEGIEPRTSNWFLMILFKLDSATPGLLS